MEENLQNRAYYTRGVEMQDIEIIEKWRQGLSKEKLALIYKR